MTRDSRKLSQLSHEVNKPSVARLGRDSQFASERMSSIWFPVATEDFAERMNSLQAGTTTRVSLACAFVKRNNIIHECLQSSLCLRLSSLTQIFEQVTLSQIVSPFFFQVRTLSFLKFPSDMMLELAQE